ncbi:sensor histidine kinase [Chondrinema litorale]|uniref:sensor histidine kinase n=1 Tax=Chondrinema litorale TaxID=2994555 RepID=UPI0025432998|nr:histidine kinase [Chondrinema litorale]UZR97372.1 histidine kinase [Chondrinema litorale]
MKQFYTRVIVVMLTAMIITFMMGLSQVNVMIRLTELDIYKFDAFDYIRRIGLIFMVSLLFLSANIFYNQINIGKLSFNLTKPLGIITFNLLIFIPLQFILVVPRAEKITSIPRRAELDYSNGGILIGLMMSSLVLMLVSVLIGTVYRFMRDNYQMRLKNEILQKETAEARFANLKEQLNPHFLFNSLSTLNGLIDESPDKAKKFLYDISDVYRYVLKNEGVNLVLLTEEMDFVNVYLGIIKERFGDAVMIKKNIDCKFMRSKVLPLSIQMLIENAIKHNNFDSLHPLCISIHSNDEQLEVENNLRPRFVANNHSLGLYNINQRYKYLSDKEVIIKKTDSLFNVQIPLLK